MLEGEKITLNKLREKQRQGKPLTMVTVYDYLMARLVEMAGLDILLVGDSLGLVHYGFDSTLPVTMDMMVNHARAVRRGAPHSYIVGDMPYMSYQVSVEKAVENGGRLMQETGVDCVKLEGGRHSAAVIEALTRATVPVMGHLGYTPQAAAQLGGFAAQGSDYEAAQRLIEDARIVEESGAILLLLEAVPPAVARIITRRAAIGVIGFGAGPHCHGQLTLLHGLLGMLGPYTPSFVKVFADLLVPALSALNDYNFAVEDGSFPEPVQCFEAEMSAEQLARLEEEYL